MKKALIAGSLLLASISQADIIKCVFTEPFIDTTYSMTQSTLTYNDIESKKTVLKNVSFQIKGAGLFELVKNGKVIQTLKLTGDGSDGMSNAIYPYEVKDSTMIWGANSGVGGCYSNSLRADENESGH